MDIKELTKRMDDFVNANGWYSPDSPKPQTARNLAISLAIETAEILEHVQWKDLPADHSQLAEELADVALYLLQLAHVTDIDLEAAILQKLEINHQRNWGPSNLKEDH
jgi:NTP pyrophosphatase (non-canonical NTP hydrolase)